MPLRCSSARLANSLIGGTLLSSFLPPSRMELKKFPVSKRARWLFSAPTFSEIDISLSLSTTTISFLISPAWLSASNAIPAVIAPSPMTDTTFLSLPSFSAATAMPSAALIDVDEWPTAKVSYSLSGGHGNGCKPFFWRMVLMRSARPVKILCG